MMVFSKGRIIGLACTLGTLVGALLILHQIIEDNSFSTLENLLDARVLLLLFVLYSLHFLAEPLRWTVYCRHELHDAGRSEATHRAPDFSKIFACFNTTALLSYSLPFKLGLPLRLYLLSHFLAVENLKIVKLMAVDGLLNLLCWAALAAVMFFLVPAFADFFAQYLDAPVAYLVGFLVVAAGCWLAMKKREQVLALVRPVAPAAIVFVVVTLTVDVLLYGVRHMVLAQILAPDAAPGTVFVIGILATFAGIISTLPMGLGAYDATLVALLALYGIDVEVSLLIAVSNRLCMIVTSIILGVPSAFALLKVDMKAVKS